MNDIEENNYEPIHEPSQIGTDNVLIRILSILIYAVTIFLNYYLSYQTSDNFFVWVTPPDYAFAIWIVIYATSAIALILASFFMLWSLLAFSYFIVYSLFLVAWVLLWQVQSVWTIAICMILLVALTLSLFGNWTYSFVYRTALTIAGVPRLAYLFMRSAIAFQLGWLVIVTLLNISVVLVHGLGVSQVANQWVYWILLTCVEIYITILAYSRCERKTFIFAEEFGAYYISTVWGIVGSAITTRQHS